MKKISIIFKILILIAFAMFIFILYKGVYFKDTSITKMYISASTKDVTLYNEQYEQVSTINRGTEVTGTKDILTNNDINYIKITYQDTTYLVKQDDITTNQNNIIKEKVMYVRTPTTVYIDDTNPDILGYLVKGSEVTITGYNTINDGIVDMYKIKYNDTEGYIYAKYLVDTKDTSLLNYNDNGTYDIHKDRHFYKELYGGKASDLDYYPYQKQEMKDNKLLDDARTLYLNGTVLNNIDEYIRIAKSSNINAFVVDIKDGFLAYKSEIAKDYSMKAYESASMSMEDYQKVITKLKSNDFYVIGRIVAFNDSHFAADNPNEAISHNDTPTSWTSAYSRKAWEYNVKLAIEASTLGFNEIQFDYVRFPEEAYSMSTDASYNLKNTYNEEKAQAIQGFIFYATDQLHKHNTYISVDVFGECANTYVTAYGQYWPAISNIVDVISAMPYPDHFNKYEYGFKEPVWTKPYELLTKWASSASDRQKEIPTPALARTWIQAYDAIHDPKIVYDSAMVEKEISALYDSGLTNGYITWNARSNMDKYRSLKDAFMKDYR